MIPSCSALQLTLIKCILIKCSVGIKFGHRRWLNSVADVQKKGQRGDRKTAKMVRMMFILSDVKNPYFTRELPVRLGLVIFDNYSEHVTQIFSSQFCMFIDAHVLSPARLIRTTVNTEKGHFSVCPSLKISCRQPRFMDTGNHWRATYSCQGLFPCHNHVLIAFNEPCSNNCRFLRVNTILLLKKRNCKIARKFDFDKAVFLPIGPCMV